MRLRTAADSEMRACLLSAVSRVVHIVIIAASTSTSSLLLLLWRQRQRAKHKGVQHSRVPCVRVIRDTCCSVSVSVALCCWDGRKPRAAQLYLSVFQRDPPGGECFFASISSIAHAFFTMSDNDNNHHDANYHHHHHSSTELPNNNNHPQQLPTPTTPALVHQHHRSRPGGPQRVSTTTPASSRVPDDAADLNNTFEEQLQLEEDQINNDDDHDAKSNALMSSAPLETVADPAECVGETDRLLDTSDQSGDATTTTTTTDDDPFGRRRASCRVRTLSGQPLSVPLNCSPAVLRHGLGTALSNNEGEVIDEEDGPADAATAATARPVGKFVEIGKRNSEQKREREERESLAG